MRSLNSQDSPEELPGNVNEEALEEWIDWMEESDELTAEDREKFRFLYLIDEDFYKEVNDQRFATALMGGRLPMELIKPPKGASNWSDFEKFWEKFQSRRKKNS